MRSVKVLQHQMHLLSEPKEDANEVDELMFYIVSTKSRFKHEPDYKFYY